MLDGDYNNNEKKITNFTLLWTRRSSLLPLEPACSVEMILSRDSPESWRLCLDLGISATMSTRILRIEQKILKCIWIMPGSWGHHHFEQERLRAQPLPPFPSPAEGVEPWITWVFRAMGQGVGCPATFTSWLLWNFNMIIWDRPIGPTLGGSSYEGSD